MPTIADTESSTVLRILLTVVAAEVADTKGTGTRSKGLASHNALVSVEASLAVAAHSSPVEQHVS